MNKKQLFLLIGSFVLIIGLSVYFFVKFSEKNDRIIVNGIENFEPETAGGEHFLLFYPPGVKKGLGPPGYTLVKEVTETGKIVREYEIHDSDGSGLSRINIHQKPNNPNLLYIAPVSSGNYFYTYDLLNNKFFKNDIDYFQYEVGVNGIIHYGEDVLFQTFYSHKTGDLNMDPETNLMKESISNYSTKESFETEYGYAPKYAPLLQFNGKIIYGISGYLNDDDEYEYPGLGIIDLHNQSAEYLKPKEAHNLWPLYATEDYLYILDTTGKMFVFDKNFQYKIYEPFSEIDASEINFNEKVPLLLNDTDAFFSLHGERAGSILGVLTFGENPEFQPLDKDYVDPRSRYEILYFDSNKNEIYIIKTNDKNETVLVIDGENFNLIDEIPIEYARLLDFVVRI